MSEALVLLRKIEEAHERMAHCAEALNWDGLIEARQSVQPGLDELMQTRLDTLPPSEKPEARARIESILLRQEQIASRAKPWMADVAPLLASFARNPLARIEE